MKRMLVVSPNWIGDALFASSALRMLKRAYPAAKISVLAVPRAAQVFERNPDATAIWHNEEEYRPFWYFFSQILKVGRMDFDAAFVLHRSRSRALSTFLAGIPVRVGYATKGRGALLTHAVREPAGVLHRVDYWAHLLRQVGLQGEIPAPQFFVGAKARAAVLQRLKKSGLSGERRKDRLVLLNPGGNWLPKRWPVARFAQLAKLLHQRLDARIGVTGSGADRFLAESIKSQSDCPVHAFAGETDLEELGALMQQSLLFVSGDSGPMHLAAAVQTPLLALFGPTSRVITGPVGKGAIRVLQKDIGLPVPHPDPDMRDMRYMEALQVQEVFEAAQQLLAAHAAAPHA